MFGIDKYIEKWIKNGDFSLENFWLMFGTFLDDFYYNKKIDMLQNEPDFKEIPIEIQVFVAASIDYLAHSLNMKTPEWAMKKKYSLKEPFFPSKLKGDIRAVMLIESPIEFKVRNIYVLNNVLSRC